MKPITLNKILVHGTSCHNKSFVRQEQLKEGTKLVHVYRCNKCGWKTTELVGAYENKDAA